MLNLAGWLKPTPTLDAEARSILLDAIETVDPLLKTVGRFEQKLTPATQHALDYCSSLAEAIPGPISIDTRSYASDPMVHAFFPTRDDIDLMLGKSREVRAFLNDPARCESDAIYFMLGMRLHEKKTLGLALHGDVIQTDVPQRILYFGDHTLREFGKDAGETRRRLRAAGFYSLARGFASQVGVLRERKQSLRQDRDMLTGQRTRRDAADFDARREALDAQLRDATVSLMPERLLDAFAAWLRQPELRLRLDPVSFAIDRMGVIADSSVPGSQINRLDFKELVFPELVSRDRRRWISIVARIQRDEARAAVAQHEEATRYIII